MEENKYCCRFAAAEAEERVIFKNDNFFVVPTVGSMGIEGYVLVVPKKHYHAIAEIPEKLQMELSELVEEIKNLISFEYGLPTLVFEHGPRLGNLDSGQSIDHAHLHLVLGVDITEDWAKDLMYRLSRVGQYYRVERVEGFQKARDLLILGKSYLYVKNLEGTEFISEQNFPRPQQYFRRMVAKKKGENWNWRLNPDYKTLEKTVCRLEGKL